MARIEHEDTCDVFCVDNGKTVSTTVMHFRKGEVLTVVLAESKLIMKYKSTGDVYVGSMMGYEFTTKGPKVWEYKEGRQR